MRLAERLGMPLRELWERMDSAEVSLWMAKDRIDPPPDPWLMTGILGSLIANAFGGGRRKWTPEDFIPRPSPSKPGFSPAGGLAFMRGLAERGKPPARKG